MLKRFLMYPCKCGPTAIKFALAARESNSPNSLRLSHATAAVLLSHNMAVVGHSQVWQSLTSFEALLHNEAP